MNRIKFSKVSWDRAVIRGTIAMAMAFLIISSVFSQQGFSIDSPKDAWVGWIMAVGLIFLELIWNRMIKDFKSNWKEFPILFVAGIVGYMYGIYTNVVGFNHLSGLEVHGMKEFFESFSLRPVQAAVGFLVEAVPESMLVWALSQKIFEPKPIQQPQHQKHHGVRSDLQEKIAHYGYTDNKNQPKKFAPSKAKHIFESGINFDPLRDFLSTGEPEERE